MEPEIIKKTHISIDDFLKVEMRVGEILSAEKVPETDKLLRLTVNFGEEAPRQVVSGISIYYPEPEKLIGTKCVFVTNLEPRKIKGLESQAMILAGKTEEGLAIFNPSINLPAGTKLS